MLDWGNLLSETGPLVFIMALLIKLYFDNKRLETKTEARLEREEMQQEGEALREERREKGEISTPVLKERLKSIDLNLNNHITTLQAGVDDLKDCVDTLEKENKENYKKISALEAKIDILIERDN